MSLSLYVMRHGETVWSKSGQHTGRADIPLTEHGQAEAKRLGQRLAGVAFDHVFVSPLSRARQTCELAGFGDQAQVREDLIEWNNGQYEGRTGTDIRSTRPGWNLFRDGCPDGEMPDEMSARVDRLIASMQKLSGQVALFTHGHLGRVLAARWIGLPILHSQNFVFDTAGLSVLRYQPNANNLSTIVLWNSTAL